MTASAVVRTRIEPELKADAESVLKEMGFTVSDYLRISLTALVNERAIPFEIRVPNAETRAAIEESQKGIGVKSFDSAEALFKDLGI